MKAGGVNEIEKPGTRMEITLREPVQDIHNELLRTHDDRLDWKPEKGDKKIVVRKALEVQRENRTASANDINDTRK
uniref:Uncharacterized protein n=1 Tax=Parascaris equorum TaxID=6256 RepID=A0A914R4U1_PAREQ